MGDFVYQIHRERTAGKTARIPIFSIELPFV